MAALRDLVPACTARLVAGSEHGSGFFVTPSVVLTCAHVVGDAAEVEVFPFGVSGSWTGTVEFRVALAPSPFPTITTEWPDIAVIRVQDYEHPACVLLSASSPEDGERVVVTGYPRLAGGTGVLKPVACLVPGMATAADGSVSFLALQEGRIRPGHSGGPVYGPLETPSGVVGVIAATTGDEHFVIPWSVIASCAELVELAEHNQALHPDESPWRRLSPQPPATRRVAATKKKTATFFGRGDELERLHNLLTGDMGRRATVTQAVAGLGGVGKTQLVAAYVDQHAHEFDVVGWVDAETDPTRDLADLGQALHAAGYPVADPSDQPPPVVAATVVDLLGALDVPWLVVFDNAPNPAAIVDYLPEGTTGQVIITSRHPHWDEVGQTVRVDAFTEDEAATYLTERVDASTAREQAAAQTLAQRLGGLPLALDHVRAYCAKAGMSLSGYLAMVRQQLPPSELFDQDPPAFYNATVATTWLTSIEAATEAANLAPEVIGILSWVAADDIPRDILRTLAEQTSAKQVNDAIAALSSYSLITPTPDALAIHRLVQDVTRDRQPPADDGMPDTAWLALTGLQALWPPDTALPSSWPGANRLAPHILALTAHPYPTTAEEADALVDLANKTSFFAGQVGAVRLYADAVTSAHDAAVQRLAPDHPETLLTRNNLAHWLGATGRVDEAIEQFTRLLDDRTRVLGPDHPHTLTTRNNLAHWLGEAGRVDEAIEQFTRLLDDRTRVLGPDHPNTLLTRNNLAHWLGEAGRVDEAIEQFSRLLEDQTRVLGPDHPNTLLTRNNLARWLGEAGRVDESIEQFSRLLDDRTTVLGPDHPDTLITRNNLASWLGEAGRVDESIEQFSRLLEDQTRVLGPDHPDTLITRNNLTRWLGEAGRVDESIEQFSRLVDDQTRVLGPDHPNTLLTRNNLASMLGRAGRVDQALEQFSRLVDDRTRVLGPDHPNTLLTRNNLAHWLGEAGRVDEAIEQFSRLLDDQTRVLGPDHPNTLTTRSNLDYLLQRRP